MDKIICIGKNYLEHAKELGDAVPEKPVLFLKPPSVLLTAKQDERVTAKFPVNRGEMHHECEIVVRLGDGGKIDAVTLGLDMTLRTEQAELKKKGHPWEVSKVFLHSAIVGPWLSPSSSVDNLDVLRQTPFQFSVDGKLRQKGRAAEMRYSIEECIKYAGEYFPLQKGDLIFTGTPAGVGPVVPGSVGTLEWGKLRYEVEWR